MSGRKRKHTSVSSVSEQPVSSAPWHIDEPQTDLQRHVKRQQLPADRQYVHPQAQAAPFGSGFSAGNMSECQYLIQQPQMHPQLDSNGYSPSSINIQPAHHQRQWSGSSTNNSTSYSFSQHACAMEEDGQSATPIAHHNGPSRSYKVPMLSHSNSAPDLRLLLSTSLPEAQSTVLPNDYSYAGAMVPYKGPQGNVLF